MTVRKQAHRAATARAGHGPAGRAVWVAAALLFVGCVLLYVPSFGNDFIRGYDDDRYVLKNNEVLAGLTPAGVGWAFTTTYFTNWLPLTWLSHMLDVTVFKLNPVGHHATSIVLHAFNAALLLLVLRRLTGRLGVSAAAAVLFAVHPLRVESVSWVAERKDVLSGAFFVAALLAYARYAERPTGRRYAVVGVLHALGLMAKTMLVTFPFVLLLLDWWPLRRVRAGRALPEPDPDGQAGPSSTDRPAVSVRWALLEKVPLLVLSAVASAWTVVFQEEGGAMGFGATLSLGDRLATAVVCVPRYLAATFWPNGLAVLYPHPGHWPAWQVIGSAALLVAVTAGCWLARRRAPYLLVGWLWFLGMLLPVSGVVQVGLQSMADRYTYLPGIGLALAVVWAAAGLLGGRRAGAKADDDGGNRGAATLAPASPVRRWAGPAGVVAASAALCVATVRQQAYWSDSLTLFGRALAVTDGNYMAHSLVGTQLWEQSVATGDAAKQEQALAQFRRSLEINPAFANGHYNIGTVFAKRAQTDAAIAEFRQAIQMNPKHELAYYQLGAALLAKAQPADAIDPLTKATTLRPEWSDAQLALARALTATGQTVEAAKHLRAAAEFGIDSAGTADGGSTVARYNLANSLLRSGRAAEAADAYREVIRADPSNAAAHHNLATALAMQQQPAAALAEFAEAVRFKPDWADARVSFGKALAEAGRLDEGERELAEGVRLDPQNGRAQQMLTQLRSRPGRR